MGAFVADYGEVDIDEETKLNVYVFNEEIGIIRGTYNLNNKLSDGRFVVGVIQRDNLAKKLQRTLRGGKGAINLETKVNFEWGRKIDQDTADKIKEELLTRRCTQCKAPTKYDISFIRFRMSDPLGGFSQGGSVRYACLNHLNNVIEREECDWEVYEHFSESEFSEIKSPHRRVKYDTNSKRFVSILHGPQVPEPSIDAIEMKSGDNLVYRFNRGKGILELGNEGHVNLLKSKIGELPAEGVDINVVMPFAEKPMHLKGVKEIKYAVQ